MAGKLNLDGKFSSGGSSLDSAFDTMFGETQPQATGIEEIRIEFLKPFGYYDEERSKLHRFKPYSDEKMQRLIEDVSENGILSPLIVRQRTEQEYEILAGHNRHQAAVAANVKIIPCIVKNIDDDEAVIIMTTTNLNQRDELLPSEKAFAYKEQMEAMKRRSGRPKNNSCPVGTDYLGVRSDELLAEKAEDSARQIQRYIRLTYLIEELLSLVDCGDIGIRVGECLSHLSEEAQEIVFSLMEEQGVKISLDSAQILKSRFKNRDCSEQEITDILSPAPKTTAINKPVKLNIQKSVYERFFIDKKPKEAEKELVKILEEYFESKKSKV